MSEKQMFNPGRDLPNAFLVTTKKGKKVFRIFLNMDEVMARLEEGKSVMALDIPAKDGMPVTKSGSKGGRDWISMPYYAWAMKKDREDEPKAS